MKIKSHPSLIVAILLSMIILVSHQRVPKVKAWGYEYELSYDVTSYYLYLPMGFIYHDPGMKTKIIDSLFTKYKWSPTMYQVHETDHGTRVPNYTIGMSYYYLPFFGIAHAWAKSSDKYPADGFSFPYQFTISWGTVLLGLIGLFLLRKYLLRFFNEKIVSLVLVWLVLGTNYFSEAISNSLQPHYMQFVFYTALLLFTDNWHRRPTKLMAFAIGFVVGWLTLARPSDILCILIPALYGISDRESFRIKIKLIRENISHLYFLVIGGLIPFIPQFIYWKINTGSFIYFSYKNTEGFDFLEPHILQVLFSFKKSLLVYTPLLLIPIFGFYFFKKKYRQHFLFVLVFTLCNFYLLSSWAAWWNGGSFGMRYFTQSYAILSLPAAACIEKLLTSRIWKYILALPLCFLIFLNLFQTWQFENFIIPDDRMTFQYYKRIFLKTSYTMEDGLYQEQIRSFASTETFDNENDYTHYTLAYYDFENINSTSIDSNVVSKKYFLSPPNSCELDENKVYYPTFNVSNKQLMKGKLDHVWIRVSLYFYTETPFNDGPLVLVINSKHRKFDYKYRGNVPHDYELNKWNYWQIDYMTMHPYSEKDVYEIYGWYRGHSKVYIDNLKIEIYERKDQLNW
jgi:hypothetical protein